jgi:NAD+ diphosphatase
MSNPSNQPDTIWLLFKGQELLVKADDSGFPLQVNAVLLPLLNNPSYHVTWYQEQAVVVTHIDEQTIPPEGYHFQHLRALLTQINQEQFALAGMASQVLEWAKSHRFCSRCGTATVPHPKGERALVCPSCQYSQYPRINPCVIVAISKDDTILLARAQRFNRQCTVY